MTRSKLGSLAFALALAPGLALAQGTAPPSSRERAPNPIEPSAMEALDRMGNYLQTLTRFEVRSETSTDEVLENGQKVQLLGVNHAVVRRPDGLVAEVQSDRKDRRFYYDGRTLTMYGPRVGYYATVPAPPTIRALIGTLSQRFGIDFPLADLFVWGTDEARPQDIRGAIYVGPSRIGGITCDQFAFRQEGVDWQVWIEQGRRPLPRRLVITTTSDPAQPQYAARLTWNLAPAASDANFRFVPPAGARRIELVPPSAAPAGR